MTNQQHPITPPPELVDRQWNKPQVGDDFAQEFAAYFARWGADQELEACCEWVYNSEYCQPHTVLHLRAARRPKPPSLKEQALLALRHLEKGAEPQMDATEAAYTIRRALESLND